MFVWHRPLQGCHDRSAALAVFKFLTANITMKMVFGTTFCLSRLRDFIRYAAAILPSLCITPRYPRHQAGVLRGTLTPKPSKTLPTNTLGDAEPSCWLGALVRILAGATWALVDASADDLYPRFPQSLVIVATANTIGPDASGGALLSIGTLLRVKSDEKTLEEPVRAARRKVSPASLRTS